MGLQWLVNRAPKYWQHDGKEQGRGSRGGEGGAKILTERELRAREGGREEVSGWKGDK